MSDGTLNVDRVLTAERGGGGDELGGVALVLFRNWSYDIGN